MGLAVRHGSRGDADRLSSHLRSHASRQPAYRPGHDRVEPVVRHYTRPKSSVSEAGAIQCPRLPYHHVAHRHVPPRGEKACRCPRPNRVPTDGPAVASFERMMPLQNRSLVAISAFSLAVQVLHEPALCSVLPCIFSFGSRRRRLSCCHHLDCAVFFWVPVVIHCLPFIT